MHSGGKDTLSLTADTRQEDRSAGRNSSALEWIGTGPAFAFSGQERSQVGAGMRQVTVCVVGMMLGTFVQVFIWGGLFVVLGEFSELYEAVYHSAVNFASLGYGDIVMSKNRKLLGPVEAINGVLMLGMSAAALTVILQQLVKLQYGEDLQAADDEG